MVDVYKQAELAPEATNKGKLLTLLRLFDSEEPTRKKFIGEMIGYVESCLVEVSILISVGGQPNMVNTLPVNQICIMLQVRSTPRNTTLMMPKDTSHWERKTLSSY